mmetsp:Transcript_16834/g.46406  ORF Transcript_16834/g.46406 Transcript_16834/m.46406 type:complete len:122 (-) Transcript_16834:55-420(-)
MALLPSVPPSAPPLGVDIGNGAATSISAAASSDVRERRSCAWPPAPPTVLVSAGNRAVRCLFRQDPEPAEEGRCPWSWPQGVRGRAPIEPVELAEPGRCAEEPCLLRLLSNGIILRAANYF